jgi:hypothetical protein
MSTRQTALGLNCHLEVRRRQNPSFELNRTLLSDECCY